MIVLNQKYKELPSRASYMNKQFGEYIKSCKGEVDLQFIREFCDLARGFGLWVYDGSNKGWSSPDAFADGMWNYQRKSKIHYDKIEFKDPLEGVIAGHKVLQTNINKILNSLEKIDGETLLLKIDELRYYQIKLQQLTKSVIEYDRRAW